LAASVAGQGFVYLYENQQENTPNPSNNLFNPDDYVYKPPSAVNQDNLPPRQPRISLPATRRRSFPEHPEDQRRRTPHQQARRLPPQSSEVQHKPMRSPPARLPPQFQSPPATDPPRQIQTTEVPTARFSGPQAGFPASTTSTGRFSIEDTYASLERRVDEYDKKQREQKRFQSSFAPSARTRSEGRPISTNSQSARPQQDYNTYSQQYRNIQTQPAKPLSRTNTYQEQYNNNQHRHTRPAQSSQRHNTYQEQYNNNQHRHTRPAQSSQRHNTYQEQYNNNQQRQPRPAQSSQRLNTYQEQYSNNQQRQTRPAQPLSQTDIYQEQYYNNEQRQTRPAQPQRQANTYQEQYNNNQQRQTRPAQPLRQANTYQEQYNNQQRQTRPAQPLRQDNTYQEQYNNNQQRQTQHTQPQQDDDYYQEQYNNNKYIEDQFSQPQHQSATYQQQYANNRKIRASNHVHQNDYQTSHTSPKAISQNYNSPQPSIFASQLQSPGLPASTIAGGGSKSLEEFYAELERSVIESQKNKIFYSRQSQGCLLREPDMPRLLRQIQNTRHNITPVVTCLIIPAIHQPFMTSFIRMVCRHLTNSQLATTDDHDNREFDREEVHSKFTHLQLRNTLIIEDSQLLVVFTILVKNLFYQIIFQLQWRRQGRHNGTHMKRIATM
ncbi:probable serine/threonine-protein kinase tsuA, partial [Limulus polyphemus]|uniref:Probable serine/threonine-protein kinase tsuA n=1 Tax=Limulus polyphemus TaxID=6850 RepID=A0ABM1S133_LIMPO